MTDRDKSQQLKKHRVDELLDEPCANPRYGGITMREAVLKLMSPKKLAPPTEDKSDTGLQFGL